MTPEACDPGEIFFPARDDPLVPSHPPGEIALIEYYAAYLISIGIGILAAVMGLGGGFLFVPTLTLVFGLDPKTAIGTSLAAMIFSSLSASFWYRRQGVILVRVGIVLMVTAVPGAIAGSWLAAQADSRLLVLIFCLMLFLIAVQMLFPAVRFLTEIQAGPSFVLEAEVPAQGIQPVNRIWYSHLLAWGFIGGLVGGATGTSGGTIFVPALATAGIPVHFAVATAMLAGILVCIAGAGAHAVLGEISWPFIAVYGAGAAFGAFIGAHIAPQIKEKHIRTIFGIFLLAITLLMFQQKVLGG